MLIITIYQKTKQNNELSEVGYRFVFDSRA